MNRRDIFKLFSGAAAIPAVKSVEELHVESGDAIVVKVEGHLTGHSMDVLRRSLNDALGERFKGTPVLILEPGIDIEVLRKKSR